MKLRLSEEQSRGKVEVSAEAGRSEGKELKIMQWNVNGLRRRDLIFSLIQMHNVDIAIFQEAKLDNGEIVDRRDLGNDLQRT